MTADRVPTTVWEKEWEAAKRASDEAFAAWERCQAANEAAWQKYNAARHHEHAVYEELFTSRGMEAS
jgi:hypothetical protein